VQQHVLSPSYVLLYRLPLPWLVTGRLGVPIVLSPDVGGGVEAAIGGIFRVLAAWALRAELVGSLFYGAATLDTGRTTIPIISLQIGVWGDYEVLP
jgi:hypothetical protein